MKHRTEYFIARKPLCSLTKSWVPGARAPGIRVRLFMYFWKPDGIIIIHIYQAPGTYGTGHHIHRFAPVYREWALRVPATKGYPPNFGGRPLPYPPGIAVLTTGYPGTHICSGYPGTRIDFDVCFFFFFQWHDEWR